jgi:drug/metabolite transporter (DMT)-like permease
MSWVFLSVCSAIVLGVYDLLKKLAVSRNAVPPVLFFGALTGLATWCVLRLVTPILPAAWQAGLAIDPLTWREHGFLFGKGVLVSASWIFGYFALKHLPITIAGPVRSSAPFWTILFAVCFLGEKPSVVQWAGVAIILAAFQAFSLIGRAEGIRFHRDKWVACLILGTLLGAMSAVYDKVLLQNLQLRVATLQFWFAFYLVVVMLPFVLVWRYGLKEADRGTFEWRWMIPAVGVGLLITDALYFAAIASEGALISVISPIRRTSAVVGFLGGILVLKERHNLGWKALALLVMIAGVIVVNWKR